MSFDDMMKELHLEYIQNLPNKIREIENLFQSKDCEGLESAFHKIKGTGKTYGVPEISILGKIMEQVCKDNNDIDYFVPKSLEILKKIEQHRRDGQSYNLDADNIYLEVVKKAA